jgi:hypothetical protein
VKAALLVLTLVACERADKPPPPKPPPPKPDPVKQARDEFELIPMDYGIVTYACWQRGDFMSANDGQQLDGGDFVGRLRTLFGPQEHDEYTLRHTATGYVIVAKFFDGSPYYFVGRRYAGSLPTVRIEALLDRTDETTWKSNAESREAADPVLAKDMPSDDDPAFHEYQRHHDQAEGGPELFAVVERLEALVDAVPPTDWETTTYFGYGRGVYRIGVRRQSSFQIELSPADAFEFLAKDAESPDSDNGDPFGNNDAIGVLVSYFLDHQVELASQRPRVLAAYRRMVVNARTVSGKLRRDLLDDARELAGKLHVSPP